MWLIIMMIACQADQLERAQSTTEQQQESTAEQPVTFWELFMWMGISFEGRMDEMSYYLMSM